MAGTVGVTETAIVSVEAEKLKDQAITYCNSVQLVEIKTVDQYQNAAAVNKDLTCFSRDLEKMRAATKGPVLARGKAIDAYFQVPQAAIKNMTNKLSTAIRVYQNLMEQKRREEQARLNAEAERMRVKQEEAAQREREKAEAYRKAGRESMAESAEQRADNKESAAGNIVANIAPELPKATGLSTRMMWVGEITDPGKFLAHCIANEQLHGLLTVEPARLTSYAKFIKKDVSFPGARVYQKEVSIQRT